MLLEDALGLINLTSTKAHPRALPREGSVGVQSSSWAVNSGNHRPK